MSRKGGDITNHSSASSSTTYGLALFERCFQLEPLERSPKGPAQVQLRGAISRGVPAKCVARSEPRKYFAFWH